MLCSVDLFPVPDKILDSNIPVPTSPAASHIPDFGVNTPSQASSSASSSPGVRNVQLRTSRVSSTQFSPPFELTSSGALKLNYLAPENTGENTYTYFPLHPFTTPSAEGSVAPPRISPFQIPRRQPMLSQLNEAEPPSDIVLRIGNHLVTESSKLTPALVGERFVEPTLIDYKGKKCLVFVFGVRLFFLCCLPPKWLKTHESISCVLLIIFRPWTIFSPPYFTLFHSGPDYALWLLFPTSFFCFSLISVEHRTDLVCGWIRIWRFNGRVHLFSGTELLIFFRLCLVVKSNLSWRNCMEGRSEFIPLENFLVWSRLLIWLECVLCFSSPIRPLLTFVFVFVVDFFLGLKCLTWTVFNVDLQSLAKYGVRVTLRDAERKSRKRSNSERDSWLGERGKTQWIVIEFDLCGG